MALGDPYITDAELASYLNTTTEPLIELACDSASQEINQWTGRQFNQATTAAERTFYAASQFLSLRHPESRYSIYVDDFWSTDNLAVTDGDTVLDVDDLTVLPAGGVVGGLPGHPFTEIQAAIPYYGELVTVTAKWGWPAVPAPVKQACYILAAETFKHRDAPFGVAGVGEFGVIRIRENPRVMSLLSPYRIRTFVA